MAAPLTCVGEQTVKEFSFCAVVNGIGEFVFSKGIRFVEGLPRVFAVFGPDFRNNARKPIAQTAKIKRNVVIEARSPLSGR